MISTIKEMSYLAFLVSSAICPEASKPVKVPAVKRLRLAVEQKRYFQSKFGATYNDRIQFQPAGAPVPLSEA